MEQLSTEKILKNLKENNSQEKFINALLAFGMGTAGALFIFLMQNY